MSPANIDSLPDELVKEILSDILIVPEDDFSHSGPLSPFGRKIPPSSEVLLVSKRWLRIGSPLLHECVVLRNSAQAGAFHSFIKGKIGSQVKGYVRRVRLEGNFGAVVGKIFLVLPNVTDLKLRLPSAREENVNGLVQGLPILNPSRIIFEANLFSSKMWKNSSTLMGALSQQLEQRASLHTFQFHFNRGYLKYGERRPLARLCEALSSAPILEQVILSFGDTYPIFETTQLATLVKILGKSTSLRAIHVHINRPSSIDNIQSGLLGEQCAEKVYFHLRDRREIVTQSQQTHHNSQHIPTLPENVLGLIIEMDLWACLNNDPISAGLYSVDSYKSRALELCHVSKTFYKVTGAVVFRFVVICPSKPPLSILKKFRKDTDLPSSVNSLILSRFETGHALFIRNPTSRLWNQDTAAEETTCEIVSFLRFVRNLSIDTEFESILDHLPKEAKLGVQSLRLVVTQKFFRQRILTQFKNMTTLTLHAHIGCESADTTDINGRLCFDNLVTLKISGQHHLFDSICLIKSCDFPSVETLHIGGNYGKTGGEDLRDDCLPSFPKVRTIWFTGMPRNSLLRLLHSKNCPVEKLITSTSCERCHRQSLQDSERYIIGMLDKIDFCKLTALRELQLQSIKEWPWQDRELKGSSWQEYAQVLVDTYGFKITDREGVPWRPRLMKRTNKKRRVS